MHYDQGRRMEKRIALNSEVEEKLWLWAAWIIDINSGDDGWPSESLFAKFAKYGFIPTPSTRGSIPLINNPRAEAVNNHINELVRTHPEWADAVYHHYTSRRTKTQKDMARERDISPRTFRDRLKRGRDWLQAKMNVSTGNHRQVEPIQIVKRVG